MNFISIVLSIILYSQMVFAYSSFVYMPWRQSYAAGAPAVPYINNCALCEKCASTSESELVLARAKHCIIVLNKFPYTKGHILIMPYAHVAELAELERDALHEFIELADECAQILKITLGYDGLNVGLNIRKSAGASIGDHLHLHVVPRFENVVHSFMQSICDSGEMPWDIKKLYLQLKPLFDHLNVKANV